MDVARPPTHRVRISGIPTREAEAIYGLSRGIIRKWIYRGIRLNEHEYGKIAGTWFVLPTAIERIIKEYGIE